MMSLAGLLTLVVCCMPVIDSIRAWDVRRRQWATRRAVAAAERRAALEAVYHVTVPLAGSEERTVDNSVTAEDEINARLKLTILALDSSLIA